VKPIVRWISVATLLFLSVGAFAGGTMQLSGEIFGFNEKTIQVNDGQHIYTLQREKIYNKAPIAKNLKRGDHVDVTVAFEGILETKEVAKNKN